jgi:hypothetical protein
VTALGEAALALREVEALLAAEPVPEEESDVPDPALEEEPVEGEMTAAVVGVWVVCASAGSCPVTSWTSTAPLAARNVASDMPATRRRIVRARCRRAASFSLASARRLR